MNVLGKIDRRIIIGIGIFICLLITGGIIYLVTKEDQKQSDAVKFKEEYSKLNGKNNSRGVAYPIVELDDENPFVYITPSEALKKLQNGTGLIYFGFNDCPWCRTLIPNLVNASESTSLGEIYYVDITDIRSTIEYKNEKLVTNKEGSKEYKEFLKILDKYLTPYLVYDEDNNEHETNEKRLYAPTLVGVANGKIVGFHEGTLEEHTNGYEKLSESQIEELNNILVDLIIKVTDIACGEKC